MNWNIVLSIAIMIVSFLASYQLTACTFCNSVTGSIHPGDSFNKCLWHFIAVIRQHPCQSWCNANCKIWWFDGWFWCLKIINQPQNDFKIKIKIINTKWFKIKIKNHSDDLKSRFKIKWFEIIPNTANVPSSICSLLYICHAILGGAGHV